MLCHWSFLLPTSAEYGHRTGFFLLAIKIQLWTVNSEEKNSLWILDILYLSEEQIQYLELTVIETLFYFQRENRKQSARNDL